MSTADTPVEVPACAGCGGDIGQDRFCCETCWTRLPDDLPSYPTWRFTVRSALLDGDWYTDELVDDIRRVAIEWLRANPAPSACWSVPT
jgi:hypothetical protein